MTTNGPTRTIDGYEASDLSSTLAFGRFFFTAPECEPRIVDALHAINRQLTYVLPVEHDNEPDDFEQFVAETAESPPLDVLIETVPRLPALAEAADLGNDEWSGA